MNLLWKLLQHLEADRLDKKVERSVAINVKESLEKTARGRQKQGYMARMRKRIGQTW